MVCNYLKNISLVIDKNKVIITFALIFFYQLLCAIQGFDLSDEGWGMYFYQQIFRNPECVESNMPFWLTGVLGWCWNSIFPSGGFLGMRLFGIILITYTAYLCFKLLKNHFDNRWLLIGLFIQTIIVAGDPKPYGYNTLTTLFAILAVVLLLLGLQRKRLIPLLFGGFILGANIFVRLPNILLVSLLLLIPVYFYYEKKKIILFSKELIVSALGVVLGTLSVILAMYLTGQWEYFINSLGSVKDSAADPNNTHQLGRMLFVYLKNYYGTILIGAKITALSILFVFLAKKSPNKIYFYSLLAIFIFAVAFVYLKKVSLLRNKDMYFVQFLSYLGLIILLFKSKKDIIVKFLALAALIMLIMIPMGSDMGILTMWTSAWLALPMSIAYIYYLIAKDDISINHIFKHKFKSAFILPRKLNITAFITAIIVFILCGIYKNYKSAYYDLGSRHHKVYSINNKYTQFIYADIYRATLMNELLVELDKYVKPNDYLLIYNFMPGLNYMTETRSYTTNSWLWGMTGAAMEQEFESAKSQNKELPVVVRHCFRATNMWEGYDERYVDPGLYEPGILTRPDQTKAINDFLENNGYQIAWTNGYFIIFIPPSKN